MVKCGLFHESGSFDIVDHPPPLVLLRLCAKSILRHCEEGISPTRQFRLYLRFWIASLRSQ